MTRVTQLIVDKGSAGTIDLSINRGLQEIILLILLIKAVFISLISFDFIAHEVQ